METKSRKLLSRLREKLTITSKRNNLTSSTASSLISRPLQAAIWPHKGNHQPLPENVDIWALDEYDAVIEDLPLSPDWYVPGMVCCFMGERVREHRITHEYHDLIRISNPEESFRFLDLPTDVQLMILDYIVNPYPDKKWTAFVNHNAAGINFVHSQTHTPCPAICFNEPVIWKNNNDPTKTTRSLLLTSRAVHDLTKLSLQHSFSGKLMPQGNRLAGLTGPHFPEEFFEDLHIDNPFVLRNAWIFDRVTHLAVDRQFNGWFAAIDIMPQLKSVKLRHHHWVNVFTKSDPAAQPNDHWREDFLSGDLDVFVTRSRTMGSPHEHWPTYRQHLLAMCSKAMSGKERSLEIYVGFVAHAFSFLFNDQLNKPDYSKQYDLCIWPQMGKIATLATSTGKRYPMKKDE